MTHATFRRRPQYVKAMRLAGTNFDEARAFCGLDVRQQGRPGPYCVWNQQERRWMAVNVGDWLISDEDHFTVLPHDLFFRVYEETGMLSV